MKNEIKLSPSTLNIYQYCPRCFWLQVKHKIDRPRGIFPSLPGGIDTLLKRYFEPYRDKESLPPLVTGKLPGKLMKNFPKELRYFDEKVGVTLRGRLDECIEFEDGSFAPVDHKTRGNRPEKVYPFYESQMDVYTLLLEENGFKTKRKAYLIYYFPVDIKDNGAFQFEIEVKELNTDPERARRIFHESVELLQSNVMPSHSKECEYCQWEERLNRFKP